MSVSLLEVIETGGYDLATEEDARWLISKEDEFEELLDKARELIDKIEDAEFELAEKEYKERFGL